MTAVAYLEYMWTLRGAIYKEDIDKALKMEKEQIIDSFMAGTDMGEMFNNENRCYMTDAEQYYDRNLKSERDEQT